MMHPGLAALTHWDREEYAAGYRARFPTSRILTRRIIVGVVAGKMPIPKFWSQPAIAKRWLKAGKTTSKIPGAISSTRGKRREPTVFRSEKNGRNPGKMAGSQWISSWGCLRSENSSEEGNSASDALSMWTGENPCAWSVCDLLFAQATG